MARKSFTEHPEFLKASAVVNDAIVGAARALGCEAGIELFTAHADRVADDMTRLLLRASDAERKSAA